MTTEIFELPFEFFLFFMASGLAFSMFAHFTIVFIGNLRILECVSRLFRV